MATSALSTRTPKLVFDRQQGEGLIRPAPDHPEDCWDGGCDECELHADDCICDPCNAYRDDIVDAVERLDPAWEGHQRWERAFQEAGWDVPDDSPEYAAIVEWYVEEVNAGLRERYFDNQLAKSIDKYTLPVTLDPTPKLPALLARDDGETLLYEGRLNTVFGQPGTGKTWIAIIAVIANVRSGARVIWWDFEDRPATLATRLQALGASDLIGSPEIRFVTPDLKDDKEVLADAAHWAKGGRRPGLVVIDSCESAGCPADSNNVAPWYRQCVDPFLKENNTVLLLDHVPKRSEDRPRGGIGSQHKLARVDGAALFVTGQPWTKKTGGKITLRVHKDRPGDLPATINKPVAIVEGVHADGALTCTITAPFDDDDEDEGVADNLLVEIAKAGADGVTGSRGIRELMTGKGTKIDAALDDLIAAGLVARSKKGRAHVYSVTEAGSETVGFVQSGRLGMEGGEEG